MSVLQPVLGAIGVVFYSFDEWTGHSGRTYIPPDEMAVRSRAVRTVTQEMRQLAVDVFLPRPHRVDVPIGDPNVLAARFYGAAHGSFTLLVVNAQNTSTTVTIPHSLISQMMPITASSSTSNDNGSNGSPANPASLALHLGPWDVVRQDVSGSTETITKTTNTRPLEDNMDKRSPSVRGGSQI
jgi:hypothetical protein